MVGLLVVTHGRFSRELIKSIELIIGHQKTVEALTLEEGDDVNKLREEVEKRRRSWIRVKVYWYWWTFWEEAPGMFLRSVRKRKLWNA